MLIVNENHTYQKLIIVDKFNLKKTFKKYMPNAQKGYWILSTFFLIKNEYDISAISWVLYYKKKIISYTFYFI